MRKGACERAGEGMVLRVLFVGRVSRPWQRPRRRRWMASDTSGAEYSRGRISFAFVWLRCVCTTRDDGGVVKQ
jgi:hypothetical protein